MYKVFLTERLSAGERTICLYYKDKELAKAKCSTLARRKRMSRLEIRDEDGVVLLAYERPQVHF